MKIKLCGVRNVRDAQACAAAGADEIGVVFAKESKRRVSVAEAKAIRAALPEAVRLVGVFQDPTLEELIEARQAAGLAILQIHGAVPGGLTGIPGLPLCRAVQVRGAPMLQKALRDTRGFDRVLLDGPLGGGSGSGFDWHLGAEARNHFAGRIFIAGGLTPGNVGQAILAAKPDGVDVSSGIEGPDGFKDHAKVRAFVAAARTASGPSPGRPAPP